MKLIRSNTKTFSLLEFIKDKDQRTRNEINKAVLNKTTPGYYASVYRDLMRNNLIISNTSEKNGKKGYSVTLIGRQNVAWGESKDKFKQVIITNQQECFLDDLSQSQIEEIKHIKDFIEHNEVKFNSETIKPLEKKLIPYIDNKIFLFDKFYTLTFNHMLKHEKLKNIF